MKSNFIFSLDLELHWGRFDHISLTEKNRKLIHQTRAVIPQILTLFKKYKIRCSWAAVGFLFAKNRRQLLDYIPALRPRYENPRINPYGYIGNDEIGENEKVDPYHYAYSIIQQILDFPGQEIGSHTFSHYYCWEKGADIDSFDSDLKAAQALASENFNLKLDSLVFPRNQTRMDFMMAVSNNGFRAVRSNPDVWFWDVRSRSEDKIWKRVFRYIDSYVNIDQDTSYDLSTNNSKVTEIPASRFFRPDVKLKRFGMDRMKILRIKKEMKYSAISGKQYHIWSHPHNFAINSDKKLRALEEICKYFSELRDTNGMKSKNMQDFIRSV